AEPLTSSCCKMLHRHAFAYAALTRGLVDWITDAAQNSQSRRSLRRRPWDGRSPARCTAAHRASSRRLDGRHCCAREHSTFISLHTRSTLSVTSMAAFGCDPVCADVTSRWVRSSPSRLTLTPAIWVPSVN